MAKGKEELEESKKVKAKTENAKKESKTNTEKNSKENEKLEKARTKMKEHNKTEAKGKVITGDKVFGNLGYFYGNVCIYKSFEDAIKTLKDKDSTNIDDIGYTQKYGTEEQSYTDSYRETYVTY